MVARKFVQDVGKEWNQITMESFNTNAPLKQEKKEPQQQTLSLSKEKKYPLSDETLENKEEKRTNQVQTDKKGTFSQHRLSAGALAHHESNSSTKEGRATRKSASSVP